MPATFGQPRRAPSPEFLSTMDRVLTGIGSTPPFIPPVQQSMGQQAPAFPLIKESFAPMQPQGIALPQEIVGKTPGPRTGNAIAAVSTPASSSGAGAALTGAFDNRKINDALAANALKPHPHGRQFLGMDLRNWAFIVADALRGASGQEPIYGPMMMKQRMERDQEERDYQNKLREPRTIGDSLVLPDGAGGYKPVYTAPDKPQPFQAYAASLGAVPGTPEYADAVREYFLKSWSAPAVAAKEQLAGVNYGYRDQLQGDRLATVQRGQDLIYKARQAATRQSDTNNRRSTSVSTGNNIRSTGTSAQNNVRSTQTSATNNAASNRIRLQTARHVRALPDEPVAVGPHGERLVVRNGQWVPAQ